MRILHTSDWHLGHTLYNFDRTEEQTAMIDQMVDLVGEHKPDLFLLSGDVYHTGQPSAAVQKLFTQAMVRLHDAHPTMTIVVTAGNHDSSSKHEIFRTPWEALKVYVVGDLNREELDAHIVEVPHVGFVAAVPYCYERNIPEGFFQRLLDRVAERNSEHLPVVMMAHTSVRGCDFEGHEKPTALEDEGINPYDSPIGGIACCAIEDLGSGYDYLALGHIHKPQFIHSRQHHSVRYSGTPLAVTFDEQFPHSVSIVDIQSQGAEPHVSICEISNLHPLVTLPQEGFVSWEEMMELVKNYPSDIPSYLRLQIEVADFLPVGANDEVRKLLEGKQARFCYIHTRRTPIEGEQVTQKAFTKEELKACTPLEMAQRFAADKGLPFDDEMAALFALAEQAVATQGNE